MAPQDMEMNQNTRAYMFASYPTHGHNLKQKDLNVVCNHLRGRWATPEKYASL